jgi:hypothetical protein
MIRLTFSHVAKLQVGQLPRDRALLLAVQRRLEAAANDPDRFTEPAPLPHRPDSLLRAFRAAGSREAEYAFTVLFARTADEMRVACFAFNTTEEYPAQEDE